MSSKQAPLFSLTSEPDRLSTRVGTGRFQLLLENTFATAIPGSLVTWVFVGLQAGNFPLALLAGWATAMTALFLLRVWYSHHILLSFHETSRFEFRRQVTLFLTFLQGFGWGFAAWVFYPGSGSMSHAFHLITITGLGAGAISSLAPEPFAIRGYLISSQLPLAIRSLSFGDLEHILVCMLSMLYLLILLVNAARMSREITTTFQLRYENEELIEKLKVAKEDAEAANLSKSEFLANMSHEIRTPMNAVLGFTSVLEADDPLPHQRERLEIIKSSATTLLYLLNNILDLSKIESGKIDLETEEFDLESILGDVAEMTSILVGERPISILCDFGILPLRLRGDSHRLRQIVTNLMGNAVKFTHRGSITLSASFKKSQSSDHRLFLSVMDTGIGIDQKNLDRIFEPFTQADGSTSRKYGGTGLGLTISRRLVDLMGGEIRVSSTVGKGTTFSLDLPFIIPEGQSAAPPVFPPWRVLVCGHSEAETQLTEKLLQEFGFLPTPVSSMEEVKSRLERDHFELLCIDLENKGLNLRSIASEAASRSSGRPPHLLAMVPLTRRDLSQLKEFGFTAWCRKPIRPRPLRVALMRLIDPDFEEPLTGSASPQRQTRALNVLVAEDNPVNQKLIEWFLRKAGHRIELAENGRVALQALRRKEFQIAFMDISMPELDGLEATRLARAAGINIPIIGLSASAMKEDMEACQRAGMNGFLAKPYTFEQLLETVARFG